MIKGFKNANIYIEGKGIVKSSLIIKDGKIASFDDIDDEDLIKLNNNLIIVPGFIDKHVHGANKSDFMYPTYKDINNIATTIASEGVTSCLATTMTQSEEAIKAALKNINDYIRVQNEGAKVLGVHLEGPFLSKKYKGAQPEEYIIDCDVNKFKEFNEISGNNIKQVTLAYEQNGLELTKYLVENKIVASLGHTNANSDEVLEAESNGATSITHTYNGMKGLHHREAGTVGGAMLANNMYCELICDLIHVSKNAIKILYKMKGKDKLCLITDGMESKHCSDGLYQIGGQDVYVKNQEARLIDGTLAGSTLKMNIAIKNIMNTLDLSLTDAIDLATINNAKCLNIDSQKGSIALNKDADFAIIDKDLNVYMTISKGKIIYKK